MSIIWKDISSFRKNDEGRIPNSFRADISGITVTIHRHIDYNKEDWLLTCLPWYGCEKICAGSSEDAKEHAEFLVKQQLKKALSQFD